MKFDLTNKIDVNRCKMRFKTLLDQGKYIELKEIKKRRTIQQNAYLHVIIQLFSIEFGYTIEEGKTHLKRECHFMRYEKNNEHFLQRTRDLDTKQLTDFIDWIRNYSAQNNCYLPTADEYLEEQFSIDKEISKVKQYL